MGKALKSGQLCRWAHRRVAQVAPDEAAMSSARTPRAAHGPRSRGRGARFPSDVPASFVPNPWRSCCRARTGSRAGSGRLTLLWRLRDRLRFGDVWVAGPRRYTDPRELPRRRDLRAESEWVPRCRTDGAGQPWGLFMESPFWPEKQRSRSSRAPCRNIAVALIGAGQAVPAWHRARADARTRRTRKVVETPCSGDRSRRAPKTNSLPRLDIWNRGLGR